MIDLLYSRYGAGAKDILLLDFEIGMEIISEAHREKNEEMLFHRWAIAYQSAMSFAEFRHKIGVSNNNAPVKEETEEEILGKVKGILDGNI